MSEKERIFNPESEQACSMAILTLELDYLATRHSRDEKELKRWMARFHLLWNAAALWQIRHGGKPMPVPETVGNRFGQLLTIAYKAHEIEDWLGKHVGTTDDWPARLNTDNEADANRLKTLLQELVDALKPFRRDYFPVEKLEKDQP